MSLRHRFPKRIGALAMLFCMPFPVLAQSTNAQPDLARNDTAFDAGKLTPLPEEAKKAVQLAQAQMKSGGLLGLVFAASPGMKVWALKSAPKAMPDFNLVDIARTTLEACEYSYGAPCAILSINGFDTHQKTGGWAKQPETLFRRPSEFDSSVLPFVPGAVRSQTAPYQKTEGARAFAVTTSGGWVWRSAKTQLQAIDKTMSDCAAMFKNAECILYAVNNRVVFGAR
jgi:hypothetical protein